MHPPPPLAVPEASAPSEGQGLAGPLLLAVPNVSEGRDLRRLEAVAGAAAGRVAPGGAVLLDVHADPDHHRAILTYAGPPPVLVETAGALVARAVALLDLRTHQGAHPRRGVVDVLPFVPWRASPSEAVEAARQAARRAADAGVPAYLYGWAAPGRELPDLRRLLRSPAPPPPDAGPAAPHPSAGVVCVGARGPLVAFNVNLRADLACARSIAAAVRQPGRIRALAFALPSRGLVQVSMNLVEPARVGPREAYELVAALANRKGAALADVEVAGLLPATLASELEGLPLRRPVRTVEEALAEAGLPTG